MHLHHLSNGEVRDAAFWKRQTTALFKGNEELFDGVANFTKYAMRHGTHAVMPTRCLEEEFERRAGRRGLVGRPDSQLADRIHDLAGRH